MSKRGHVALRPRTLAALQAAALASVLATGILLLLDGCPQMIEHRIALLRTSDNIPHQSCYHLSLTYYNAMISHRRRVGVPTSFQEETRL